MWPNDIVCDYDMCIYGLICNIICMSRLGVCIVRVHNIYKCDCISGLHDFHCVFLCSNVTLEVFQGLINQKYNARDTDVL